MEPNQSPKLSNRYLLGRGEMVFWTVVVGGCLLWSLMPALDEMRHRWANDPKYSHGWLVAAFSVYLLWLRRDRFHFDQAHPSMAGLGFIVLALGLQIAGALLAVDWLLEISLLPVFFGLSTLLLGWRSLIWTGPAIGFLGFMAPLPAKIETALAAPLQTLAARVSAGTLQILGQPAVRDGNVLRIGDIEIGVAEACSGLAMLMTFIAVSTAVALLSQRSWPIRLVILLTAAPIAIIANVMRIAITGVLNVAISGEVAHFVFHDLAGWLMMPLALGLLWLTLAFLDRLVVFPATQAIPISANSKMSASSKRAKRLVHGEVY